MAVVIDSKSVSRQTPNIIIGEGEVPATRFINEYGRSVQGWALPDGTFTESRDKAKIVAKQLDKLIRANL